MISWLSGNKVNHILAIQMAGLMKVAMVATSACRPARPCAAVLVLAVTMPPSGEKYKRTLVLVPSLKRMHTIAECIQRAHFGSSADQVSIYIINN
jgi:hypothetical protein